MPCMPPLRAPQTPTTQNNMHEDLKELSNYKYEEESDDNSRTSNSEDDDEIEEEIDIYLNNINENNLNSINTYLIQYPLRPKYRPYNYTNNIQKIYACKNYSKLKQIKSKCNTNEETYIFEYKLHEYMKEEDSHDSITIYRDSENERNVSRLISTSVLCEYITNCVCLFQYNEIKKKKEIYMVPLKHIYQFKPCHDTIKLGTDVEGESKPSEQPAQANSAKESAEQGEGKKYPSETNQPATTADHQWTSIVNIYEPDSLEAHEMLELFTNVSNKRDILSCRDDAGGSSTVNDNPASGNPASGNPASGNSVSGNSLGESPNGEAPQIRFHNDGQLYLNHMCKNAKEDNTSHLPSDGNVKDRKAKDSSRHGSSAMQRNEEDVSNSLNMLYFFSLNLDEQILKIMRLKNVQKFGEIQKIIKKNIDQEILLNTVQKYCVNVLGLWIIKSKYLYKFLKGKEPKGEGEKKDKQGENFSYVDYKIRVRDLLLVIIFKQVEPILLKHVYDIRVGKKGPNDARRGGENDKRSDGDSNNHPSRNADPDGDSKKINSSTSILMENFEKATNLPNNALSEMFLPLCEYKYTGYFFKHKMDEEFVNNHTQLCLSINEKWKKKMVKIAKIIQTYKNSKIIINDYKLDIRTLEKNITDVLHNNCIHFDDIYNRIRKDAKNTSIDLPLFMKALNNIALQINNIWFLRIENQSEFNKCRNAVINIFQTNHNSVFSKNEIVKHVEMFIQSSLTIPDIYFRNILKEFCVQRNGVYLFKGNDQLREGEAARCA
ncbi:DNA-directed RNA polymerase III subunit RPC5, putative [Plasmodium vivax]|uniref:DNA-directed RNA polymerase III subunit RPC5, putative n=1 Tax=Plasmodium vivax TaxID=5855 RepID=A0A1G4H263_PLAVI|nr:DNA-directed RNA polymerase III subunit RPC5, putative [Plasmodium vivax]